MWASLLLAAMAAGDPVVIAEFDEAELPASLTADAAKVRRVEDGAGGALEVTAIAPPKDGRAVVTLPLPVKDIRGFEAISFRASATQGKSATFLEFASAGGWRGLWAKEILEREPREFVIPLRQFREFGSGLSADPANLHRLR
ncbi:MAG TPA: hypothetical protein VFS92_01020, partial [Planctomycetota bacterium]|nr:hypothetical protein [Planctomycetota bacterium]